MAKPIIRIHNQSTGEIIDREMTDAELAIQAESQRIDALKKIEEAEKITAKADLLAKLGITEDEAKLLLG